MGYTHYFPHTEVSEKVWGQILLDCKKLYNKMPKDLYLADWNGEGLPEFNADEISFNGVGDNGHETFTLTKSGSGGFEFCKTARKPYDLMVCACLIVYRFHSPATIELSSDGDPEDWEEARAFVTGILGAEYLGD